MCKNVTSSINSGLLSTELMPKLVAILWARFFWVRCKYKSLQDIHMCNLKWMIASRNKSLPKSRLALLHILIEVTQKVRWLPSFLPLEDLLHFFLSSWAFMPAEKASAMSSWLRNPPLPRPRPWEYIHATIIVSNKMKRIILEIPGRLHNSPYHRGAQLQPLFLIFSSPPRHPHHRRHRLRSLLPLLSRFWCE